MTLKAHFCRLSTHSALFQQSETDAVSFKVDDKVQQTIAQDCNKYVEKKQTLRKAG